jgi:phosphoribosylformylglycinamidine synthase (EC 6.3.5.3)
LWSQTSARIAALRDDPDCVVEALDALADERDAGLRCTVPFTFDHPPRIVSRRPPVAILREQGVNGQAEMAWAFDAAGFEAVDVHMSDLASGRHRLDAFAGFAACGGFSYGDVLGAGRGWAASILFNAALREQFSAFLADPQRFALGVCNGCQMLSTLAELIPGSQGWPRFVRNRSEQFEARWSQVTVPESRSIFLAPMAGASLPVAVAHGEGRAVFAQAEDLDGLYADGRVSLRFTAADGLPAQRYPANPNGSPDGITGICNADGRVTLMMPHPERSIAPVTGSWWPQRFAHSTPWIEMFRGARRWVG